MIPAVVILRVSGFQKAFATVMKAADCLGTAVMTLTQYVHVIHQFYCTDCCLTALFSDYTHAFSYTFHSKTIRLVLYSTHHRASSNYVSFDQW